MKNILFIIVLGVVVVPAMGFSRPFYSVSIDTTTQSMAESKWNADDRMGTWAPQTIAQIAARGVMAPFTAQNLVAGASWEMDLGVLQLDGNILHLLGTATVTSVTTSPEHPIATVSADLMGTQNAECRATLQSQVDVTTQRLLVQKLNFSCLGKTVRVATAALPKE